MSTASDQRWTMATSARLDVALAEHLHISRTEARRLLERGQVSVNQHHARAGEKGRLLQAGDAVVVHAFVAPAEQEPIAQPELNVPVLNEGDGWVVFDKPSGMPVHPLSPDEQGTLLNHAIARYPHIAGIGEGGLRSGVVHRLDVDISGCLVLATTQAMWQTLTQAFHDHTTTKIYHAIVKGRLTGEGREEVNLIVAQHHPARVKVLPSDAPLPPDARRCFHTWRALDASPTRTLVEVNLGTGFLHQIRATFAHRDRPVLGDALYGDKCSAPRLMLHATHLEAGPAVAEAPEPLAFSSVLQGV